MKPGEIDGSDGKGSAVGAAYVWAIGHPAHNQLQVAS